MIEELEERWITSPANACGTNSGYRRHLRAGEPTCQACRKAHTADKRIRLNTPEVRAETNARAAAGRRAQRRLAAEYPNRFRTLLYEQYRQLPERDPGSRAGMNGRVAARGRAQTRLLNEHKDRFRELLAEEYRDLGLGTTSGMI